MAAKGTPGETRQPPPPGDFTGSRAPGGGDDQGTQEPTTVFFNTTSLQHLCPPCSGRRLCFVQPWLAPSAGLRLL